MRYGKKTLVVLMLALLGALGLGLVATGVAGAGLIGPQSGASWMPGWVQQVGGSAAPVITSVSPSSCIAGSGDVAVSIIGSDFIGTTDVSFFNPGGVALTSLVVVSDTHITAVIPASAVTTAVSGPIVVLNAITWSNEYTFTVNPAGSAPTVSGFVPTSGPVGTSVTVYGTHFLTATRVDFVHNWVDVTPVSDSQITVNVPVGALTGPISVTNPSGTGTSAGDFTVTAPGPVINSLSPVNAIAGGLGFTLHVAGVNFATAPDAVVYWNSTPLAVTTPAGTTTNLYVTVPAYLIALPGTASITVHNQWPGGTNSSPVTFTITGPTVTGITPATGANTNAALGFVLSGDSLNLATSPIVTLRGTGTNSATTITAAGLQLVPLAGGFTLTGTLNLASVPLPGGAIAAPTGVYDVVLTYTNLGTKTFTLLGAFTVTGPSLTAITPATATNANAALAFTLTGTGLNTLTTPAVTLRGPGTTGTTVVTATGVVAPVLGTTMTGVFNLTAPAVAPSGLYDVVITYAGTKTLKLSQAFTVTNALPTITSLSPNTAWAGSVKPQTLTVTGTGFVPAPPLLGAVGSMVKIGARVTTNTTFVSSTQLTVPLTAADIATAAAVPVTVINPVPGGGTSAAVNLTVNAETTTPVTTITGADTAWHNAPVTLTVAATDSQSGVQSTQYQLGITSPTPLVGTTITIPADGSVEGATKVSAWSTDWCGHVENPGALVTVNMDTVAPKAYGKNASGTAGKNLTIKYKFTDNVSPKIKTVYVKIKNSKGNVTATLNISGQKNLNTWYSLTWKVKTKGTYKYYVHGSDLAGNTSKTSAATITVQ